MGAIGTDKGDRQIDPTEGIKEFIERRYKAYGGKGKQDNDRKQKDCLPPE